MLGPARKSLSALLAIATIAPIAAAQTARRVSLDRSSTDPVVVEKGDFDGESKNWLRDLSFTIRNVGTRPIYAAEFDLVLSTPQSGAKKLVLVMRYGKEELVKTNLASSKDKALNPDKATSIRLSNDEMERVYEHMKATGSNYPAAVTIRLRAVYFGDGSGWRNGHAVQLGGTGQVASRAE